MANLRDIQKRIKSIKNTQQITKAMKMVSAAKLRRAQEAITEARPYAEKMAQVISSLAKRTGNDMHPLLEVRKEPKNAVILVLTSDRGLCGSFNSNVLKQAQQFINEKKNKYENLSVIALSKRANDYFSKRGVNVLKYHAGILNDTSYQSALIVSEEIIQMFLDHEIDEVYVVYTQFKSAIAFDAVLDRILPLAPEEQADDNEVYVEYIFEPSAEVMLLELLEKNITTQIHRAMLDSVASEHGARMTAMDAATNNSSDMIKKFTLIYNRARQAAITTELVEIVSGAEALKG
ncbi:ATP synthase F1 subunit gamma [Thermodesulfobacteriota bacterium]